MRVLMITGDHPRTARAIAAELGLPAGDVVTGAEIEQLDDEALDRAIAAAAVFARVAPEHKLRLVRALQARGEVVAMTGDGVNDAPALRQADIGVAMGRGGTAAAKEAADMVLADDDFGTLRAAVEEGRRVFDNLVKALTFVLPTSLGQALIIAVAVLAFPPRPEAPLLPVEPVQILWINLIVAVALALPLALEAPEPDIMRRPPRDSAAPLLDVPLIVRTLLVGVTLTAVALVVFWLERRHQLAPARRCPGAGSRADDGGHERRRAAGALPAHLPLAHPPEPRARPLEQPRRPGGHRASCSRCRRCTCSRRSCTTLFGAAPHSTCAQSRGRSPPRS